MKEKDAEVIQKILEGDKSQFAYLVEKYKGKIAAVVYSYLGSHEDIEGAVQETFLRGYKQLSTLTDTLQFGSWILRIARNLCIDKLRKKKEDVQSLEHVEEKGVQVEAPTTSPLNKMIEEEETKKFEAAFNQLDPTYRELLILKNFHNLSYEEIQDLTGYTKAKIGEILFKARKQLGEIYKNLPG